jgi:hypothetical protein
MEGDQMNETDLTFLRAKLGEVAHLAFVDIRNLARRGTDELEQIRDLADTAELIPSLLVEWDDVQYGLVRSGLIEYARKYGGAARRLVETLDLDPASFAQCHADPNAELWTADPAVPAG